ncbi:MAG TPA: signal peptidase I [Rectinemataceae bacterium]|nr:signal peptidase I [Rectinemataceae bacterium]
MTAGKDLCWFLQTRTEALLTLGARRRLMRRMRQAAKSPVLDWVEAVLWAACVVLIVNQYLLQAYRIPSASMADTLLVGDMIFVDKLSFGPELLPGVVKTPGLAEPRRGQIVVFENPSYLQRGPLYSILQQTLYMLSLTLLDIDRDEGGSPRVHYLIKRAVGMPGDRLRIERGELSLRFAGAPGWISEAEYKAGSGQDYGSHRSLEPGVYPAIEAFGRAAAYGDSGLPVPAALAAMGGESAAQKDLFAFDSARVRTMYAMHPQDFRYASAARRYAAGWYIPEGRVFPMGDNRDNSRDARYFGTVAERKVLGKALFIYWPLVRAGSVR